ncbi:HAD-IIB family hydrolase [Rummeliibacillus sp. TYF-LIM-RU47]|uniref:HAD-IIB family hydrolase n=1 Tax=unclassified Rummeliibacillus TaxID=2622809 RepID=UPI001681370C|nr:HAD-IIB family hydrolase [Rummeliibacillus sp. TYF-LIM-RU47]
MNAFKNNIIATDLDNTLVGDEEALRTLLHTIEGSFSTIFITGRHKQSTLQLLEAHEIPLPDILVCDAGATIYTGPDFQQDIGWKQKTQAHWEPEHIKFIMTFLPSIAKHPVPNENRLSYTIQDENIVEAAKLQLKNAEIPCHCIYSSGKDFDILPEGANKGSALQYVIEQYASETARVLAAGDSGNDEDMLTQGFPAVVVANHQPELEKLRGYPNIHFAEHEFAAGILEGWEHFYSLVKK